ncbi:uncharacterized protein LOC124357620 isoform X2 [Homalodisca vitripennis]|uniref:uncharacterized protein LOC124357620 isoform X2 n=1 Tax=Homalodisca vitripennis TaxID=197043 RepID=UPI001EEB7EEB|nr:uncharacterized protein LOC124357620 isoform X2 [Homalodisca vitripennis]
MSVPQLDSCCCGCSLKTGSKIIGWISMIANIVLVIILGLALAGLYYIEEHRDKLTPEHKDVLDHLSIKKSAAIMMIIIHVIGCILSLILLIGVYQQKAKLVLTWVLISLTCALIEQLIIIFKLFTVYQAEDIGYIIWFLFRLYFFLVVYSFYREIQNVGKYA